ncbi:hypothetical protein BBB39_12475 [Bordetella trematum]|uniref:Uncharacterized protein n=1 Tax=Bordetella trematum TaxID=123899 RepID=A0A146AGK8_9BORD|nr:hypothetical protein [Bordetella trematum]AZR94498.1 hypothetical protein BBB39_12475 [Bordetella trematum]NNH19239.1 hypothetical protein [Bordetella trematum]CZZ87797.1 Uncharacterised protein [Bordetella trematum]SAI73596.1 Uncharacterised protein [Bordetella trematum]SUV97273.1 Uncharacterised protein [Bordetella trematum]
MRPLGLFETTLATPSAPYAIDPNEIGGAIRPFIRFCRERLSAPEGAISLALIIEESWKRGRNHPYLTAWDAFNRETA